jgi:hypothetical protein
MVIEAEHLNPVLEQAILRCIDSCWTPRYRPSTDADKTILFASPPCNGSP